MNELRISKRIQNVILAGLLNLLYYSKKRKLIMMNILIIGPDVSFKAQTLDWNNIRHIVEQLNRDLRKS